MARSARKLVLSGLRTRVLLLTVLLALSQANDLPGGPRVPALGKKNSFLFLRVLSASALHRASTRRYLTASRAPRYKCRDWYHNVLLRCTDEAYRGYMRMSRATFESVVSLLRCHAADVFVSRHGSCQLALEIQVALTLYRLGSYGNATRVEAVADLFGVSAGTVVKSTRRVIAGLQPSAPTLIVWPNSERSQKISDWAGNRFGFDGCIGATDGTTIRLAYQPALHPGLTTTVR